MEIVIVFRFLLPIMLTLHTVAHTDRGEPTLTEAEQFRTGFNSHDH